MTRMMIGLRRAVDTVLLFVMRCLMAVLFFIMFCNYVEANFKGMSAFLSVFTEVSRASNQRVTDQ